METLISVEICWFLCQEKFRKLLDINESLGGEFNVIGPTRELVKEGKIVRMSARNGDQIDRYLFLVCSSSL